MIIDFDTVKLGDIIEAELDLISRLKTARVKLMVVSLENMGFSYNGKTAYDVELFVLGENEMVFYQTYDSKYYNWDESECDVYERCSSKDEEEYEYNRRIRFISKVS